MILPRMLLVVAVLGHLACGALPPSPDDTPLPASLDEFRAAAARILERDGIPGAGIALIRPDRVEWAGGIGIADREAGTPVTAGTLFRAGSVSKTLLAIALVQQYEDGALDLEAAVTDLLPQVTIENPFTASPVNVLHLLQHTAGFEDMRFSEMYNRGDPPDLPLIDVLRRNPASRRVRWRPGTRMSYSNPGYTVAAAVLEHVTGRPYEDVIRERIFTPLDMPSSGFSLDAAARARLARGYDASGHVPVPLSEVYHRPAWNLHTSAEEFARFVQMLLNWGETDDLLVIDPEYLSNMERPRTSVAAAAGLIYGYGSGIISGTLAGYPVLGHHGRIEGFTSAYGYAAGRDAGWVVLVNASDAAQAVDELAALAVTYLKRDIDPPAPADLPVTPPSLVAHEGYYHPTGAAQDLFEPVRWLLGGVRIRVSDNALIASHLTGPDTRFMPMSDVLFRREADVTPSRVFTTTDDGQDVLLGDNLFAIRTPRWQVEIIRIPVFTALAIVATWPLAAVVWLTGLRQRESRGFWGLKLVLGVPLLSLMAMTAFLSLSPIREWGVATTWTRLAFLGSWGLPLGSVVGAALAIGAWRAGASPGLRGYGTVLVGAAIVLTMYAGWWRLIGIRLWTY